MQCIPVKAWTGKRCGCESIVSPRGFLIKQRFIKRERVLEALRTIRLKKFRVSTRDFCLYFGMWTYIYLGIRELCRYYKAVNCTVYLISSMYMYVIPMVSLTYRKTFFLFFFFFVPPKSSKSVHKIQFLKLHF